MNSRLNYFKVKEVFVCWARMSGTHKEIWRLGKVKGKLTLLNKKESRCVKHKWAVRLAKTSDQHL